MIPNRWRVLQTALLILKLVVILYLNKYTHTNVLKGVGRGVLIECTYALEGKTFSGGVAEFVQNVHSFMTPCTLSL